MIIVKNLNKSFIYNGKKVKILKDVNFSLNKGDSLAIMGKNGSGKSTLINIIAGVDRPDTGEIISNYKISWPIGLAAGLQGSLTARDNVIFVSKLLINNKDKKLIKEKIDFVKDFSGLGEYFYRPIKTYSSGMRSRLSFSLSIAFKFDLYLIDEITAAGDLTFRKKCRDKLIELKNKSDFIYVSHNLGEYNQALFNKAAIINNGYLIKFDNVKTAVKEYKKMLNGDKK